MRFVGIHSQEKLHTTGSCVHKPTYQTKGRGLWTGNTNSKTSIAKLNQLPKFIGLSAWTRKRHGSFFFGRLWSHKSLNLERQSISLQSIHRVSSFVLGWVDLCDLWREQTALRILSEALVSHAFTETLRLTSNMEVDSTRQRRRLVTNSIRIWRPFESGLPSKGWLPDRLVTHPSLSKTFQIKAESSSQTEQHFEAKVCPSIKSTRCITILHDSLTRSALNRLLC